MKSIECAAFALSAMFLVLSLGTSAQAGQGAVRDGRLSSPPECMAHVGYDRDADLPGYLISEAGRPAECVPVTITAAHPPPGYHGDYYVAEFSDAKLRARWAACKAKPACYKRVEAHITSRLPPNKEHGIRSPRARYLLGMIDPAGGPALEQVRRPAFFARAPYREDIAKADPHTFTISVTAQREPYERLLLHLHDPIQLRGWYLQGRGVDDGKGGRKRALVILSNGGGGRLVAIDDPKDRLYHVDAKTGKSVLNKFPNARTGAAGQRVWRALLYHLYAAGFDVLSYDRRGVGVSDGYSDTNTLQQGRDILRVIESLKSGKGLTVLSPSRETLKNRAASAALLDGADPQQLPVILGGESRGTMATGWAMTRNFDRTCEYDMPQVTCGPPRKISNIKGAIEIGGFSAGVGYGVTATSQADRDRALYTAGTEVEDNIVFFPSSAILSGIHRWPAAMFVRGLWDYAESLAGAIDGYNRVQGLKELVVVRGPHPIDVWPDEELERVTRRMIAFSRAVILGLKSVPGAQPWHDAKSLAATAAPVWEPSSRPGAAIGRHAQR